MKSRNKHFLPPYKFHIIKVQLAHIILDKNFVCIKSYYLIIENCDVENLYLYLNHKCLHIKVKKIYETIKINSYKFCF